VRRLGLGLGRGRCVARGVGLLLRHQAAAGQRGEALAFPPCQCEILACMTQMLGGLALQRTRGGQTRRLFVALPGSQWRRLDRHQGLARLHGIAVVQSDARDAPGERRADQVPVVAAGFADFVDGHDDGSGARRHGLHLDRRRP
jgi:hypothetical protein